MGTLFFVLALFYIVVTEGVYIIAMWKLLESRLRGAAMLAGSLIMLGAVAVGYSSWLWLL